MTDPLAAEIAKLDGLIDCEGFHYTYAAQAKKIIAEQQRRLEVAKEALKEISEWDDNGKICGEYGCAAPEIAKTALATLEGE